MRFTPAVVTGPVIDEQAKFGADAPDVHVPDRVPKEEDVAKVNVVRSIELPTKISPMHAPPGQPSLNVWQFPQIDTHASIRVALYSMRETKFHSDEKHPRLVEPIPTLKPIARQFGNANEYIKSIAHLGKKYGAIKIIPPPEWQSPACINLDNLCFNSIRQEINPAGSSSTEGREFLKALALWHDRKGSPLRIPSLDRRALDLFRLFKVVNSKGGAENVTKRKLWAQIGRELGYSGRITTSLSSALRSNYIRLVKDFADHLHEKNIRPNETTTIPKFRISDENGLEVSFDAVVHTGIRNELELQTPKPDWATTNPKKRQRTEDDDLSEREASIVADQRAYANQPRMAYYTLRQFDARSEEFDTRRYGRSAKPPAHELEQEYWRMLTEERIEVERANSRTSCVFPEIGVWWTDQWNFRRLPWLTGAFTRYIDTDFPNGQPSQDIGMTFSTWDWEPVTDTEVVISDWGAGTTYYVSPPESAALVDTILPLTTGPTHPASIVQNGGKCYYADLYPGELLVLFDGARKYRWSHGSSLTESVTTVLPEQTLERSRTHCVERTLEVALQDAPDIETVVVAADLFSEFAAREMNIRANFKGRVRPATPQDPHTVECAITGHILHYSWVEPDDGNTYLSVEAAIEKGASGTLVTRIDDLITHARERVKAAESRLSEENGSLSWQLKVQDAFRNDSDADADVLAALGKACPSDIVSLSQARTLVGISDQAHRWDASVQVTLGQNLRARPRRSALMNLIQERPDAPVRVNGEMWERLKTVKQEVDEADEAVREYFAKGDFSDIESAIKRLTKLGLYTPVVLQVPRDLEVLLARVNALSKYAPTAEELTLEKAQSILQYCQQVGVPSTAYGYQQLSELVQRSIDASGLIEQWTLEGYSGPNFAKLMSLRDRKPGQLLLTEESASRIRNFGINVDVVNAIGSSDLAKRPLASQLVGLDDHAHIKKSLMELAQFQAKTSGIDWSNISRQAFGLASNLPSQKPVASYSVSGLLKIIQEARELAVRPDNLSAILAAVPALTSIANYSPELLQHYGFVP